MSKQKKLSRVVDIVGAGVSEYGLPDRTEAVRNRTTRELWAEAADRALRDAGVSVSDIEALFVGNMRASYNEGQYHNGYVLGMCSGLEIEDGMFKSAVRIDAACASSSHAIRNAVFAVASGMYDIVLAGGVDNGNTTWDWKNPGEAQTMTEPHLMEAIFGHLDQGWEMSQMNMLDHTLSQWMLAYAKHYGLTKEQMLEMENARVRINLENGIHTKGLYWNPPISEILEQEGFVSLDEFLNDRQANPPRNWPIRRWDYQRRIDGAAAVVICAEHISRSLERQAIHYLGTGNALQQYALSRTGYTMPFIEEAGRQAYEMAGVSPGEIDLLEMYDFGPSEYFIPIEDLGYWGHGESYERMKENAPSYAGTRPVNPYTGGSTCGAAAGAIGAACIHAVMKELRGEADGNQIDPQPRIGMIYDCGGARNCVIHILGR